MRELEKWVIVPTGVSSMHIEGRCAKTGEFVTTKNIQRRLGNYRVVAVGGVCYQLRGHLDWDACFQANIPVHILDEFKNGVPPNWKRIIHGWPPTTSVKQKRRLKRRLKRRASAHRGSSTMTRPVSVLGTPQSHSELYGRHKYNLSGEQAEIRSFPRIARITREERASQAERGTHVDSTIQKSQPRLKNLQVILEPLPKFTSFKWNIRKCANEQICSTPVSAERRSTRSSTSGKKGSLNHKRCSNSSDALVVTRNYSLSKQEMSMARPRTGNGPVLATKGTAASEVASCSGMQRPASKVRSDVESLAKMTSGPAMVNRRRSASCPGLVQLGEGLNKVQQHVHSSRIPQCLQKALRRKHLNRKMAVEPGASQCCKEKKGKGSTTVSKCAMKTPQTRTSVCTPATTFTRSSLRMTCGGSLWSAKQECKKERSKQSEGHSHDRDERSRKHPNMDPLKLHPDKRKGKAASLFFSPPRRQLRSTSSFFLLCTRSGRRYTHENTGLGSRNSRLAKASSARRKLDLTNCSNSENSPQEFKDSGVSKLQKAVGGVKQHEIAKCVGEQTAMSPPQRLSRNRTGLGIYSEAKPSSSKETVEEHSSAMKGRRRTRSLSSAGNTFSWGKKENEVVQAEWTDTNSSQPNTVSISAATKATLVTAKQCTLKEKGHSSRNEATKKQDTLTAVKTASEVHKPPVSAASKGESSAMQVSKLSVASMPATEMQLRKADERRTPHALGGPPIQDMAESVFSARKSRRSTAQADMAKAGHASGATAAKPPNALPLKKRNRALKRKHEVSAEKPDVLMGQKKPKENGEVQKPAASPCAVKMGSPRFASTTLRSRKQAGTPNLSHNLNTAGRVPAAGAHKKTTRCEARVSEKNSAKERHASINKRPEAREARQLPARSCQQTTTARGNFICDQKAGSSKAPANITNLDMPSVSAATGKPDEGDNGQKTLQLQRLCTRQISPSEHLKPTQKERPSKARACAAKAGHATEANTAEPGEALLSRDKVMALRQKCGSGPEEPNSLHGQQKGENNGAGKHDASTGRSKGRNTNQAQTPPPSSSPEVCSDQHCEPTLKKGPRKKASKPGDQTVQTGSATEAVQQRAVLHRVRTAVNDTEKHGSSADQNEPQKADKTRQSPESVHHALERKMSGLKFAPAKLGLVQGSKSTAGDHVLAATAQEGIIKQTRRTSKTEDAGQTVRRKTTKSRARKGDVQKPASSNARSVRELSPEAGPSYAPTGPRKCGKGQKPTSDDGGSECEFVPPAGPIVGQAPKSSADARFTAALLAITARKGTKKRRAQVKQLTEALAARDTRDDIYGAAGAPVVVGDIFDEDPWAQMSDVRASSIGTPTPNSPNMSPNKSCLSFSSDQSAPMSVSPPHADAIMRGIRGKKAPALLPSSTPKIAHYPKKKHLSVSAVVKNLQVLGEAMDRDQVRANCAESSNEEGSDSDSSGRDEPPLLLF